MNNINCARSSTRFTCESMAFPQRTHVNRQQAGCCDGPMPWGHTETLRNVVVIENFPECIDGPGGSIVDLVLDILEGKSARQRTSGQRQPVGFVAGSR